MHELLDIDFLDIKPSLCVFYTYLVSRIEILRNWYFLGAGEENKILQPICL